MMFYFRLYSFKWISSILNDKMTWRCDARTKKIKQKVKKLKWYKWQVQKSSFKNKIVSQGDFAGKTSIL